MLRLSDKIWVVKFEQQNCVGKVWVAKKHVTKIEQLPIDSSGLGRGWKFMLCNAILCSITNGLILLSGPNYRLFCYDVTINTGYA